MTTQRKESDMSQTIIPSPDQHREPRATYLDEEHGRYVFDTSGGECDYCAPGETCHLCDGFTETVEHFESFADVTDARVHGLSPAVVVADLPEVR